MKQYDAHFKDVLNKHGLKPSSVDYKDTSVYIGGYDDKIGNYNVQISNFPYCCGACIIAGCNGNDIPLAEQLAAGIGLSMAVYITANYQQTLIEHLKKNEWESGTATVNRNTGHTLTVWSKAI